MTRSFAAAELTLNQLCAGAEFVYLWTFTTEDKVDRYELAKRWDLFRKALRNRKIDLRCVRTFEPHGNGHGMHIHFVTPDFHHVNSLRPLAEAAGFGRINAKKVPENRKGYILKYIRKVLKSGNAALKGAIKWRACGSDRKEWHSTARCLIVDTGYTRAWAWLKVHFPRWDSLPFSEKNGMISKFRFNCIAANNHPYDSYEWRDIDGQRLFQRADCPF